jgi:hypothetical protein
MLSAHSTRRQPAPDWEHPLADILEGKRMRLRKSVLQLSLLLVFGASLCSGQSWSGVLASNRAIDWSQAGAGTIPTNRTQCGSTIPAGSTAATINSAITSCSNAGGGYVLLAPGSFSVAAVNMKSNVTLRGAGPQGAANGGTDVKFTAGTSCGGLGGNLCIWNGDGNWSGGPDNTATWSSGYAKGSTTITLSGHANLTVGSQLFLDQLNNGSTPAADTGNIFICGSLSCTQQGQTNGRNNRGTLQIVTVTSCGTSTFGAACTSNTIGIDPGVYPPNISAGLSPGAWWASALPISGVGVENVTLDFRGTSTNGGGIMVENAINSWVKNIRSLNDGSVHKHIWIFQSSHITVRDSYFYGANGTSESYGVDHAMTSDDLVENNIFQHISNPTMTEEDMGSVNAYNFATDHFYNNGDPAWQQDTASNHDAAAFYTLWEGNIGDGIKADDIHGMGVLYTNFRNVWSGRDLTSKTEETMPVELQYGMRYYNFVGNVLGTVGYHTNYQVVPATTGDAGNSATTDKSIYSLGFSGNEGTIFNGIPNDLLTATTLMRWGNYDTVTGAVRWCKSGATSPCNGDETGSAAPAYPGLAAPSQTLPASFYLSAKPNWWGGTPWPAIGPDVSGGNVPNVAGHANYIPAANCYLNVMKGATNGTSGILTFNPGSCYTTAQGPAPATALGNTAK